MRFFKRNTKRSANSNQVRCNFVINLLSKCKFYSVDISRYFLISNCQLFLYAVACIVFPQYILSIVFRFPTEDNFVVMLFSITFPLHHRKNISYAKYDFLIDSLIISIATRILLQTDHLIII